MNVYSLSWESSNWFLLHIELQCCQRSAKGKVTAGRPTWFEFVMVIPVKGDILNGMVGHPDACAGR